VNHPFWVGRLPSSAARVELPPQELSGGGTFFFSQGWEGAKHGEPLLVDGLEH